MRGQDEGLKRGPAAWPQRNSAFRFLLSASEPDAVPLQKAFQGKQAPRPIPVLQSDWRRCFDPMKDILPLARNPLVERKSKPLLWSFAHPLRDLGYRVEKQLLPFREAKRRRD